MKVRILNLDFNNEAADYLTIGKTYEATKQDDAYRVIEDNGSHKWWIREDQVKVIKQRKVYLKKVKENDEVWRVCEGCYFVKTMCPPDNKKYGNCYDEEIIYKLIKIEEIK